jgi:hypothetical protein
MVDGAGSMFPPFYVKALLRASSTPATGTCGLPRVREIPLSVTCPPTCSLPKWLHLFEESLWPCMPPSSDLVVDPAIDIDVVYTPVCCCPGHRSSVCFLSARPLRMFSADSKECALRVRRRIWSSLGGGMSSTFGVSKIGEAARW